MKKNSFLTNMKLLGLSLCSFALITQCAPEKKEPFFKISLAQWSINKMVKAGTVSQYDFARLASEWGFEGIEYVSQLYFDVAEAEDKEMTDLPGALIQADSKKDISTVKGKQRIDVQVQRDTDERLVCSICSDEKKEYMCTPCNHICLCLSCKNKGFRKCPMCRADVERIAKVFI